MSSERILGKQVIDANGWIVGSVKDVAINLKSKELSFRVATKSGSEVFIRIEDIAASGDVILLSKPIVAQGASVSAPSPSTTQVEVAPTPAPQAQPPGLCPVCHYQNDPGSRFCIKCGTKLKP
ncbi:MAG: zinc-ribbon domain-containing protein [Candidatus Bathyarchaeia archaeon]